MPASRRVNFAYVDAVSHANALWRTIVAHVGRCEKKCKLIEAPGGGRRFAPTHGCDWGEAFEDEWRIALKRREAARQPVRGGSAPTTTGDHHENRQRESQ